MGAQSAINRLLGTAAGGILAASKISSDLKESNEVKNPKIKSQNAAEQKKGIDAKMAAKARRLAQQKINAIQANKEISNKAKTRRIGKVLDELTRQSGGEK